VLVLGLEFGLGCSHDLSQGRLKLGHRLAWVVNFKLFRLHCHQFARFPRLGGFMLIEHVPLFLHCGLACQFVIGQPLAYNLC